MKYLIILWVICALFCGESDAASFNCKKATIKLEKTICNTPRLNEADTQLGKIYSELRKSLSKSDAAFLKKEQIAWLKEREKLCSPDDVECLLPVYEKRIALLQSKQSPKNGLTGDYSGVYVRTHQTDFFDGKKSVLVDIEDCLSIQMLDKERIKFSFILIGSNAHTCSMEGVAVLKGDAYEYLEKSENESSSDCLLRIRFLKDKVVLEEDEKLNCRMYCGARIYIGTYEFFMKDKSNDTKCEF